MNTNVGWNDKCKHCLSREECSEEEKEQITCKGYMFDGTQVSNDKVRNKISVGTNLAYDLLSWLESAVCDIAEEEDQADELFDDYDTVSDLMRDRIFEGCKGDQQISEDCCKTLLRRGHTTLKKVVRQYMKDHNIEDTDNAKN